MSQLSGWKSEVRVPAWPVWWEHSVFLCLHLAERVRKLPGALLIRTLIPFKRAPPSWLNLLPKIHLLTPYHWGLGSQHTNVGETHTVCTACIFMDSLEHSSESSLYSPVIQADASISQMVNCDHPLCMQSHCPLGKDFWAPPQWALSPAWLMFSPAWPTSILVFPGQSLRGQVGLHQQLPLECPLSG